MTSLLITVFCLGLICGMIYTLAVYHIVERRNKRKDDEKV